MDRLTELITNCINGNRSSQSRLYQQYASKMFGVCLRYAKNREEAEEIMQEAFVQVFKSLPGFRHQGSFEGWIRKIMIYCAIGHYRSKPKMIPYLCLDGAHEKEIGKEDILPLLHQKELISLVQALPPAYRMVFNLYVFEGMLHREIAAHLGIAEGTSKSNLYNAKMLLQKAFANSMKIAGNY
ncbi:MAG: RNA polymerase sigma factor [Chitinophagaceae bacterium]|nr:RNA polymerase sigma factor [Chitinophagaceae bacterium]